MAVPCRLWDFSFMTRDWTQAHSSGSPNHWTTSSVQFNCSVLSNSLRPHESQHARPPCPSPIPRVHPNPCPSSQWCHPAISSSVIPFSSCPQSLPASGSFPMSQLFASGGQSIGVSALATVLPKNTQDWSPLEWTGWISLQSKGLSRVFSDTTVQKHQFFGAQLSSHPYVTTGKAIALTRWTFVSNLITLNCDHFLHKNYVSITYSTACYYQKSPSAPSQKEIIPIYIFILRMGLPRWH